jgi:hypothetical protein
MGLLHTNGNEHKMTTQPDKEDDEADYVRGKHQI